MHMQKKRILLISFSELPTMQRYLYLLYSELSGLGQEVFTIGSKNVAIDVLLEKNNYLVETPESPKPTVASFVKMMKTMSGLSEMIVEMKPDIIHFVSTHTWNYFLLSRISRVLPSAKRVHTFHDPVGHEGDSVQKGVVLYHRLALRKLDCVMVHSDVAKRQTVDELRPKCPVFQAPLGVTAWFERRPLPEKAKEVLIFGRLNAYKGVRYYPAILDAIHSINPDIHVTIAGRAAKEIDKSLLLEVSSRPNCTLRNEFIPEDDIDDLFNSASLVLVPYLSITQSGVILDAYCRSRSVVAFDIPGISEYVPDADSRVPAFECNALARRACERLSSPDLLKRKSEAAWLYGKKHFTPQSMAKAILFAYRQIGMSNLGKGNETRY